MGEDRTGVDEIEVRILERQMWKAGREREPERRAQMLLTPEDMGAVDVDAPDLAGFRDVAQPADHETIGTSEVEDPTARPEHEIGGAEAALHVVDHLLAEREILGLRAAMVANVRRRNRQLLVIVSGLRRDGDDVRPEFRPVRIELA